MIRLGINTMVWSGRFVESQYPLLAQIRAWGYDTAEVTIFDFDTLDPVPLRRAAADAGLDVTVCSVFPASLSFLSDDAKTRESARSWLQRAVDKVAAFDATLLAGPLYHPVGALAGRRRTESEWSRAVEGYRRLGEAIRASGVRIAVEPLNRFETYFLNTAADTLRFCREVDDSSIGVLFDTFHANIEEDSITDAIALLGHSTIHVHLSENNRGIPGSGHIPFREVAGALRSTGYEGHAVVESFATTIPELAAATGMWRDYASSPDEFARQTIANLRPVFA